MKLVAFFLVLLFHPKTPLISISTNVCYGNGQDLFLWPVSFLGGLISIRPVMFLNRTSNLLYLHETFVLLLVFCLPTY